MEDEGVVEFHAHRVSRKGDGLGYYCTFVYLDGRQCSEEWKFFPSIQVSQGCRWVDREAIRAWIKAGGKI